MHDACFGGGDLPGDGADWLEAIADRHREQDERGLRCRSNSFPTTAALPISACRGRRSACRQDADGRIDHRERMTGDSSVQDLFWIAVTAGLLALTLAYFRLCEKA